MSKVKFEVKNEPMVVISMPEFVVPKEKSKEYLLAFNKFTNDLLNEIVLDDNIYKVETPYFEKESIPVVTKMNSYDDVFDTLKPEVKEYGKYVYTEDSSVVGTKVYVNKQDILDVWNAENKNAEQETEEPIKEESTNEEVSE